MITIKVADDLQCPQAPAGQSPLKLEYIEIDHEYMSTHTAIVVFSCPHCTTWWMIVIDMSERSVFTITQITVDHATPIEPEYSNDEEIPF